MKYIDVTQDDQIETMKWVEADPAHKDVIKGDFWAQPIDEKGKPILGIKCIKVQDDSGTVFYLRLEQALRVYIQFPPEQEVYKSRVAFALRRMIHFIGERAKIEGYQEAVFNSKSEHLIAFLDKLGIKKLEDTFQIKL